MNFFNKTWSQVCVLLILTQTFCPWKGSRLTHVCGRSFTFLHHFSSFGMLVCTAHTHLFSCVVSTSLSPSPQLTMIKYVNICIFKKREKKKKLTLWRRWKWSAFVFTPLLCQFVYIRQTSLLFWAHCKKEKRNWRKKIKWLQWHVFCRQMSAVVNVYVQHHTSWDQMGQD